MIIQNESLKAQSEAASLLKPLVAVSNPAVASVALVSAASVSVVSVSAVSPEPVSVQVKVSKVPKILRVFGVS
jgi:hypothetical protein